MLQEAPSASTRRSCETLGPMSGEHQQPPRDRWQRPWFAVVAGVVAPYRGINVTRQCSRLARKHLVCRTDSPSLDWAHRVERTGHFGGYVLQGISLLSGIASGAVAAWLSPPRSRVAVAVLLGLSLVSVFFAQLPQPRSVGILVVWAVATPIGICSVHSWASALSVWPNPSLERTSSGGLCPLPVAAHVKR